MTIPRWRLAIVAAALIVLSAIGGGLAQAATAASAPAGSAGTVAPAAATSPTHNASERPLLAAERLRALRGRFGIGDLGGLRKHLVHATVTVLDRDGKLITLQLDHGTIASIGDGTVTIAEAGGSSVTVATSAETRVRKDRAPATLAALAVGDEAIVVSVLDSGTATARRIVVPPAAPAPAATPASPGS